MSSDVKASRGCVMFVYNLYARHESGNLHIVMAVFRQQELSWQFHLSRTQREIAEESALLFNKE